MSAPFDPADHLVVAPRFFEELVLGERFVMPSRTVTDAHFAAFQVLSGDNHPIHYDRDYCKARGHQDLLAHGLQVLCFTAAGAGLFPHVIGESLIGFVELSSRFLKPVVSGDTLYPALTVAELKPQRTTGVVTMSVSLHNQRREMVLEGWQKYLLRRKNPAG